MEKRRHGRPNQVLGRLNSNGEIEGESSLGLVTGAWILHSTDEKQRQKRK